MTDTSDQVTCAMCQQQFMPGAPGSTVRVVDHGEDHYCPLCWSGQKPSLNHRLKHYLKHRIKRDLIELLLGVAFLYIVWWVIF